MDYKKDENKTELDDLGLNNNDLKPAERSSAQKALNDDFSVGNASADDALTSDSENNKAKKKKHIFLTTGNKIIIAVVAVILALLIAGGIYCITTSQNPIEAVQSIFSSDEEMLIGKWDSQASPGLSAYVFYDDGTYDNYLSTVNFSGKYTVSGNKITLINPDTNKEVVYKFKVTSTELTLTLVDDDNDGEEDVNVFDRVDELNQKTLTDLIGELATDSSDEETTEEETTAEEITEADTTEAESTEE